MTGVPLDSPPTQTGENGSCERKQHLPLTDGKLRRARRYRRRRRKYGFRVCVTCGGRFEALTANARFCRPTDDDRKRALNSQPRSWCAKAYSNAVQRGAVDQLLARVSEHGGRLEEFDCAWCSKRCVPGVDVPPHASRFCSKAHKRAFHHAAERASA